MIKTGMMVLRSSDLNLSELNGYIMLKLMEDFDNKAKIWEGLSIFF